MCKVAVNYWWRPVPVKGLQSMVRFGRNRCNHFIQPFLFLLITRIRIRLKVVSWVWNIPEIIWYKVEHFKLTYSHWLVDSPDISGKLEPTLLHGSELGVSGHVIALEPLDVVPELPDGALPGELISAVVWVVEVLVLIKHQPDTVGMTSVGILKTQRVNN